MDHVGEGMDVFRLQGEHSLRGRHRLVQITLDHVQQAEVVQGRHKLGTAPEQLLLYLP